MLYGKGSFDVVAELDALGAQLTMQLQASRHHSVLVADRTLANVAYARLLLPARCLELADQT